MLHRLFQAFYPPFANYDFNQLKIQQQNVHNYLHFAIILPHWNNIYSQNAKLNPQCVML